MIDEQFLGGIREDQSVTLDRLEDVLEAHDAPKLAQTLRYALRNELPLLKAVRDADIDLASLRLIEFNQGDDVASCGDGRAGNLNRIKRTDLGPVRAVETLVAVLAEELEEHPERDEATRVRFDRNDNVVHVHRIAHLPIPDDASVLVLDATADPDILDQLIPGLDHTEISVAQNATVTQVVDRTGSNTTWAENPVRVDDLKGVLQARSRVKGESALVVAHKALAGELREAALPENVKVAHFGALRGSNEWEDCDTIFITGRNQPPPSDVEALARAIWWKDPEPLTFDKAGSLDAEADDHLPTELRGYRTADPDDAAGVYVRAFTDPRIEAVHEQLREAETAQALARLRLVRAKERKHVFLLSNLPVDVTVDRLVGWDELMPNRLDKLFAEYGSLPLGGKGLRLIHSGEFKTEAAARSVVSRHGRETYAPYQHNALRFARFIVTFRQIVGGVPSRNQYHHLFDAVGDAHGDSDALAIPMPSLDTIRATLEHGLNSVGDGWGEVEIVSVELAPAPNSRKADSAIPEDA